MDNPAPLEDTTVPTGNVFQEFVVGAIVYSLMLYSAIRIVANVLVRVMEIYEEVHVSISLATASALGVAQNLSYYGLVVALGGGLLLGGIHAALRRSPQRRRYFNRAAVALIVLGTAALLLALNGPLLSAPENHRITPPQEHRTHKTPAS